MNAIISVGSNAISAALRKDRVGTRGVIGDGFLFPLKGKAPQNRLAHRSNCVIGDGFLFWLYDFDECN